MQEPRQGTKQGSTADLAVGCGAGFSGDRVDAALPVVRTLVQRGGPAALIFEMLAERTLATAQLARRADPGKGYEPLLDLELRPVLADCLRHGITIVGNFGAANPQGAARRIVALAEELGLPPPRVAVVSGDDLSVPAQRKLLREALGGGFDEKRFVCANAYLGAFEIAAAIKQGAQVVVTGRVADPSIFMAPMMFEFGWDPLDHARLGAGNGLGHLIECGAQVTGGYFSDPGFKDAPDPWNLAFPIVEVESDGSAVLTKVAGTGGAVNLMTVKEQLLYEVHDPANYLTPDVVVDFTTARLEQVGLDRVRVTGIGGKPRTPTLKVSIGCTEGFIGEDMFFYAGPGALRRAQLAKKILEERFKIVKLDAEEVRIDFLGINAIHGAMSPKNGPEPYEVAVRVAARTKTREEAFKVGREVDGMAVSGVGMTGKRVPHQDRTREIIGVWSSLVPREKITPTLSFYES